MPDTPSDVAMRLASAMRTAVILGLSDQGGSLTSDEWERIVARALDAAGVGEAVEKLEAALGPGGMTNDFTNANIRAALAALRGENDEK